MTFKIIIISPFCLIVYNKLKIGVKSTQYYSLLSGAGNNTAKAALHILVLLNSFGNAALYRASKFNTHG